MDGCSVRVALELSCEISFAISCLAPLSVDIDSAASSSAVFLAGKISPRLLVTLAPFEMMSTSFLGRAIFPRRSRTAFPASGPGIARSFLFQSVGSSCPV